MSNPFLLSKYWAMDEGYLRKYAALNAPASLPSLDDDDTDDDSDQLSYNVVNGVAVIPLQGVLVKTVDIFGLLFGGVTSTVEAKEKILAAVDDDQVRAICVYVDSPGGDVAGTADLADALANSTKPTVAFISDIGASGAYWVASQCDAVYANKTASIGSIGVYCVLQDTSKLYEDAGVSVKVVKAGDYKGAGVSGTEITDKQLADWQREIDDIYSLFVEAVAKGRKLTEAKALSLATGQTWIASKAKNMGLIDGVASIEDVIRSLSGGIVMGNVAGGVQIVSGAKAEAKADAATPIVASASEAAIEAAAEQIIKAAISTATEPTTVEVTAVDTQAGIETITVEKVKFEKAVADAVDADAKVKAAHTDGYAEAIEHEKQRFAAVLDVCKGNPSFAIDQFLKGNDKGKSAIEYAAHLTKQMSATRGESDGVAAIATVVADVRTSFASNDFDAMWAQNADNCTKKFSSKENFISFKKYEAATAQGK